MSDIILETQNLSRHFGALMAVDDVTLQFERSLVYAVLGPNGAGKTTLINLLSGEIMPSGGSIRFKDQDITNLPANAVSQLGIGRSFQKTNIFPNFTCFENCRLAAQSRMKGSFSFFKPALSYRQINQQAERALEMCGLSMRCHTLAQAMSYGEQRQLEIGMMLATGPELLLLDEPLAGMGADESLKVIELLRRLAKEHTLILIEHDMDAVFAVADRLAVMVNGRLLETGTVAEVRASKAVQEAYLGAEDEH
ncbi:MAG: ABC transporter ATP-binding protein [Alphaproteobacteria bacterium]|nr:ABC transporter ATP-binding protein [Alphaproteobacteria bacterium]